MSGSKPYSFSVSAGGRLLPHLSRDSVGPENYQEKLNWRRVDDKEVLREGTLRFAPVTGASVDQQSLLAAPIKGIWEATRPNGERAVVAATQSSLYRFNLSTGSWDQIGTGFAGDALFWDAVSTDGYLILNNGIDLPVSFRVEDSSVQPLKELREIGVAAVQFMKAYLGFLFLADVTDIQADQLGAWMNGSTPYARVPANITNRVRYKQVWSDYQKPLNFSPYISGTIASGSKNIVTLGYMSSAFTVGTKVAVVGAGIDGGTLGGDTEYPDGVPITAINGNQITLAIPADSSNTFPAAVGVTRWTDVSTFSGYDDIKDDGSPIVGLGILREYLVVYRESGIFLGRYTGIVKNPFRFNPVYRGSYVPFYPRTIIDVEGDVQVYATRNRVVAYDGTGAPRIMDSLDQVSRPAFAAAGDDKYALFCVHNPITREIWLGHPGGVVAYDYLTKTTSTLDEAYSGAVYAKTSPSDDTFRLLLAKGNKVLVYGATEEGPLTYYREGSPYTARITFGLINFNAPLDHKELAGYLPQMSSSSPSFKLEYKLYGSDSPHGEFDLLASDVLSIPELMPMVYTYFRNVYFYDQISVLTSGVGCEIVGRTFRVNPVRVRGITRTLNGY